MVGEVDLDLTDLDLLRDLSSVPWLSHLEFLDSLLSLLAPPLLVPSVLSGRQGSWAAGLSSTRTEELTVAVGEGGVAETWLSFSSVILVQAPGWHSARHSTQNSSTTTWKLGINR